jgi:urease accessory protein|tara:strand:+ start:363 stop:1046 length:684 start_codon:yes stop_codon:yes gene_type:complete
MSDVSAGLLSAFQYADSFFPTGSTSLSNGLEALVDDGVVGDGDDLEKFVQGQIRWRWEPFERPFVVHAIRQCTRLQDLLSLDNLLHAQSLSAEAREGSIRTGRALLRMHVGLATRGAVDYQRLISDQIAKGHNAVMQGLVWGRSGLPEEQAELISAHTFCVTYLGAAIRLGVVGHQSAQGILTRLHREVADQVRKPCSDVDAVTSFCPEQEIGMMRHEKLSTRLFLN